MKAPKKQTLRSPRTSSTRDHFPHNEQSTKPAAHVPLAKSRKNRRLLGLLRRRERERAPLASEEDASRARKWRTALRALCAVVECSGCASFASGRRPFSGFFRLAAFSLPAGALLLASSVTTKTRRSRRFFRLLEAQKIAPFRVLLRRGVCPAFSPRMPRLCPASVTPPRRKSAAWSPQTHRRPAKPATLTPPARSTYAPLTRRARPASATRTPRKPHRRASPMRRLRGARALHQPHGHHESPTDIRPMRACCAPPTPPPDLATRGRSKKPGGRPIMPAGRC